MDIFCVGMYRSCSTWQYLIASRLIEQHRGGQRLGFVTGEQYQALIEREPPSSSWRILKAHEPHPSFESALSQGAARAIYAFRDLRDVAFSLIHVYRSTFEHIVEQHQYLDICIKNDHAWKSQCQVLAQRYEDLMADPTTGVRAMARHFGIALTAAEAIALVAEFSWSANRRRTEEWSDHLRSQGIDLESPASVLKHDQTTLLHWNHLRRGRVGGWRRQATSRQREVLHQICGDWLIEQGYEIDNSWLRSDGSTQIEQELVDSIS